MRIVRGRILSFDRRPEDADDTAAWTYIADGALAMDGGRIVYCGDADGAPDGETEDHRDRLILPGFIDPHIHFPQTQVTAAYARNLLEWLDRHTFPAEAAFADPDHAAGVARIFFDLLIAHGTTSPVAYCTSHPASVDAYFAEAARRGIRAWGGKTCMDRNAPDPVLDTPQRAYDESRRLIGDWDGRDRLGYVITPRFAITSSPEQLEALGALAREFPRLPVQTHLSENHDEIKLTAELFGEAIDYLDVYDRFGLLGAGTLLGHAIHLSPRERARLAEVGAVAVHCPTSNLFLGSGLFDGAGLAEAGCRTAVATDIGGGTSWSMLKTLDEAFKIAQLRGGRRLDPMGAFWWATLGNAEALGAADRIGTLAVGSEADAVVLDAHATPAMAARMARVETLPEELFLLQTLGDDRAVAQVYIAGEPVKGQ